MIFIDSDNAMGSRAGNVDDGYAIAALLASGLPITGIASVDGNTSEAAADLNNRALGHIYGFRGPYLRHGDAAEFLAAAYQPMTVAALGPLTNIAAAIRWNPRTSHWCSKLVVVGGNAVSRGRWPPWWPYEFNLTADLEASRAAFASPIPWTLVPIDVLSKLWVSRARLAELGGPAGEYLRRHSQRWLRRTYLRKWTSRFRVGDLAAAMYLIDSAEFTVESVQATMHRNAWIDFRKGEKEITIIRDFNGDRLWRRFAALVSS